jgi:hypothetical protein
MSAKLRQQIESLRSLAPLLNNATDEAAQVVQAVEQFLGEQLSLGVSAESGAFEQQPRTIDGTEHLTVSCLAYGRLAGKYRLHVLITTERQNLATPWDNGIISSEQTAWSSCPREVKLQSFSKLPELLGILAEKADQLAREVSETSTTVRDLLSAIGTSAIGASANGSVGVNGSVNGNGVVAARAPEVGGDESIAVPFKHSEPPKARARRK